MALKARMYSVAVQFFKQTLTNSDSQPIYPKNSKVRTLIPAKRVGNKLLLSNFQTNTLSICLFSNGLEYKDGIRELNIGDDVFVCSKKANYITFAHYKMISLYAEDNCELIYSARIYDYDNIDVPKASYKSFIKDFKCKHNL